MHRATRCDPGAPPYDGVYRGSWRSPGVCLRLDLTHAIVPEAVRARLRAAHPEQIGADGALYEHGVETGPERDNRAQAVARLVAKEEGAVDTGEGSGVT